MTITLLAPESAFGRAVVNLHSCLLHTPQLEELALQDGVPWSRYHTCLADMGGFMLTFPRPVEDGGRQHEMNDGNQDIGVDGEIGGRNKPPSLPRVAVVPLSPINLDHTSWASPGHHGGNRLSSPGHQYNETLFARGSIDIEAGSLVSSPPHARLSCASSTASSSSSSLSTMSPPTADLTEMSRPSQDKTMLHGTSLSRHLFSGKDLGESPIRTACLRHIERATRHYGPVAWNPHPDLVALSKMLIASMTNTSGTSPHTKEPTALPLGMVKVHLIRHLIALEGDATPLCAAQLVEARRLGLISRLPYVTEAMLRDRDKGDTLVKLAAVWQTIWLAIDLAARQAAGLPSSPLEFTVLAFSVLALQIYLLNWFAPKDVQTPFYVPSTRLPTADELRTLAVLRPHAAGWQCPGSFANWCMPSVDARQQGYFRGARVWVAGMAWSGMVFGSLHLLAWEFTFPTVAEKWLWRAAALMTTVWPLIPGMLGWVTAMLRLRVGSNGLLSRANVRAFWAVTMVPVLAVPLVCARVFLLVEAYRSLYYLPSGSYVTTWTADVPRFG